MLVFLQFFVTPTHAERASYGNQENTSKQVVILSDSSCETYCGAGSSILHRWTVVPLSFALITIAPKYLPAPEVGLYLLLETLIGPLIVWLLVDEAPRLADYIGGLILITALVCLFSYRMKTANRLTHHY